VCGIAGFISNNNWREEIDSSWINGILEQFETVSSKPLRISDLGRPLNDLSRRFDDLMSFGLHLKLVEGGETLEKLKRLTDLLDETNHALEVYIGENGRREDLDQLSESA
jgi:glutamine---fructose-6-phosphate transaminase (isomerizing)